MKSKSDEADHVLFKDRKDWEDVIPIENLDPVDSLCVIAYTNEYRDALGYFRAVVKCEEKSTRVLELLEYTIRYNPSFYTAWNYRLECVLHLKSDLRYELWLVNEIASYSPKCYQLWNYRRRISDMIPDKDRELKFTSIIFAHDSKNYHSWMHRQYVVAQYQCWEEELKSTTHMIENDHWNNSAWNERYFVYKNGFENISPQDMEAEIKYVISIIDKDPLNSSPFLYIKAFLQLYKKTLSDYKELEDYMLKLKDCPLNQKNAIIFLLNYNINHEDKEKNAKGKIEMLDTLIKIDSIRSKYWNYRKILMLQD